MDSAAELTAHQAALALKMGTQRQFEVELPHDRRQGWDGQKPRARLPGSDKETGQRRQYENRTLGEYRQQAEVDRQNAEEGPNGQRWIRRPVQFGVGVGCGLVHYSETMVPNADKYNLNDISVTDADRDSPEDDFGQWKTVRRRSTDSPAQCPQSCRSNSTGWRSPSR
ncbi:hypothetical protein GCM10022627_20720 [Haloarcula argentinensis]